LSIFFGAIFVLALAGQSVAGLLVYNAEQASHGGQPTSWTHFVTSSAFVVDVAENWQSEYLQFFLFIFATIWLVQKGSPESKKPGDEGIDSDENQLVGRFATKDSPRWAKEGGWRRVLYSNSLLLVMGSVFLASWFIQSLAGTVVYNDDQRQHGEATVDWLGYVATPDFWNRTLQNWQSEFLAVGTMIAFSIYLRQRGSSESKPVGTPHHETATEAE
jgi:membrane protein implicated in regulation of membrane protease activity